MKYQSKKTTEWEKNLKYKHCAELFFWFFLKANREQAGMRAHQENMHMQQTDKWKHSAEDGQSNTDQVKTIGVDNRSGGKRTETGEQSEDKTNITQIKQKIQTRNSKP